MENPTQNSPPIASHDLLAVLRPVIDWYHSDEHPERNPLDIIREIVADLQSDRAAALAGNADKRRLDWLETHPFTAYRTRDHETCQMPKHFTLVDEDDGARYGRRGTLASTLRGCIDIVIHSPANVTVDSTP